jgi:hypothetical protein
MNELEEFSSRAIRQLRTGDCFRYPPLTLQFATPKLARHVFRNSGWPTIPSE